MDFFLRNNDELSLDDYKEILENYDLKFRILFNLKEGMKIGKTKKEKPLEQKKEKPLEQKKEKENLMINGEYCLYENNVYQKISRWWYCENRGKTFGYLDKDFTKFAKFLDLIKIEIQTFNSIYYKKLSSNIKKLINRIIPGLYNLKKTYSDEKKIVAKVDSIILTLIDFKTEMSKKKIKNKPFSKSFLLQVYNQACENNKKMNYCNEI